MQNTTPLKHLNETLNSHPNILKLVDLLRKNKNWPSWCFLPEDSWEKAFSGEDGVLALSSVITWGFTKGIYRFDPSLALSLPDSKEANIPSEVFYRLPEWAVYVETPSHLLMKGFFATLQFNSVTRQTSLTLITDSSPINTLSIPVNDQLIRDLVHQHEVATDLAWCISYVLYLCSDQPEIVPINGRMPSRAKPKKTHQGWKMFLADNMSIWLIGKNTAPSTLNVSPGRWDGRYISMAGKPQRYHFMLMIDKH